MEVLSRNFYCTESQNELKRIKICMNAHPVSHLLFAGDLLILMRAKPQEVRRCHGILEQFSDWS